MALGELDPIPAGYAIIANVDLIRSIRSESYQRINQCTTELTQGSLGIWIACHR